MPTSILTEGLGVAPYGLVTGGLIPTPTPTPTLTLPIITRGLGVAPYGLVTRGLGLTPTPTPTPTPLVIAGWDARPLADDDNPFGVDPDQTFGVN